MLPTSSYILYMIRICFKYDSYVILNIRHTHTHISQNHLGIVGYLMWADLLPQNLLHLDPNEMGSLPFRWTPIFEVMLLVVIFPLYSNFIPYSHQVLLDPIKYHHNHYLLMVNHG